MLRTLSDLAEVVGGKVVGDPNFSVMGISSLEIAGPNEISFLTHPRHAARLRNSRAGAVIVANRQLAEDRPMIVVSNPYLAYARIAQYFNPTVTPPRGIAAGAYLHPASKIGRHVCIAPTVCVERDARIGDGVVLFPGVWIGEGCVIGEDSALHPGVVLYPKTRLGKRVIVHAGTVIGCDGFGYARDGIRNEKIPQLGIVRIDDDVEIGANNTIDRASFGVTWIQRGVKTDNLVHIGHNVVVGEDSILVAQVGVSGTVEIGRGVILAGQVGIADHLRIGDGAIVGPQSGVGKDVAPGAVVSGSPAISHRVWLRAVGLLGRLPELLKRVRSLEKRIEALEKKTHA